MRKKKKAKALDNRISIKEFLGDIKKSVDKLEPNGKVIIAQSPCSDMIILSIYANKGNLVIDVEEQAELKSPLHTGKKKKKTPSFTPLLAFGAHRAP